MQSPDLSQNYFELFGLPVAFDVDLARLRSELRRLQASFHPDRHVNGSDRERRVSVQVASWINQAHETLQDPVKRARYLLEISGAEIADDSATTSDTGFLMEQLELREEIEACGEAADGLQRSQLVADRLAQRADQLAGEFVSCFAAGNLAEAMQISHKMQFIQRIQQQLDELQFDLEGR
jgi:molecular chaperone HscB